MAKYTFHHAGTEHQEGQGIYIKPSHKGLLHQEMGIPEDKKIPMDKLHQAMHSEDPKIRKQANFAINFGHKK